MPINPAIISGASSGSRGVFGVLSSFLSFILKSWKISVPLLILSFMLLGSIVESVQQKSAEPILYGFIATTLSFNHNVAVNAQRIIDDGGIVVDMEEPTADNKFTKFFKMIPFQIKRAWRTLASVSSLVFNLIMFFWLFYLFYKVAILITNNQSAVTSNILIMLLLVYTMTTVGGFLLIYPQYEKETGIEVSWKVKINPFYGIIKFFEAIPHMKNVYTIRTETIQEVMEEQQSPINFT